MSLSRTAPRAAAATGITLLLAGASRSNEIKDAVSVPGIKFAENIAVHVEATAVLCYRANGIRTAVVFALQL